MTIAFRSGLLVAVEDVRTYFVANGVTANVLIGWKDRTHQDNQGPGGANRIVFTPSGDDKGAGGKFLPPRFVGNRPLTDPDTSQVVATVRPLIDWERRVLVSIWARDNVAPEDEAAQIEAVEDLFEWTVRAVHEATGAFASAVWSEASWTVPGERSYGLEMRAGLTYRHPIFDRPRAVIYPTAAVVGRQAFISEPEPPEGGDT